MTPEIENKLLLAAIHASKKAGDAVLEVYNSDFSFEEKLDNSPLTLADKNSNDIIISHLKNQADLPAFPFLSEEGRYIPYHERKKWEYFWLVDPLDGTKEFIKRNGEFTINIALINCTRPIIGIVYIPVKNVIYFSSESTGAYKLTSDKKGSIKFEEIISKNKIHDILDHSVRLPFAKNPKSEFTVVASRSHMNIETEKFIDDLKTKYKKISLISIGSSIKLCLVAEGSADIYPRLGPTMEWDTAAAHAIVNAAGKKMFEYGGEKELSYNKEDLKNPWFVVR